MTTRIHNSTLHAPSFAVPLLWFEKPSGGVIRAGVAGENMHGIGAALIRWLDLEIRWADGTPQRLAFKGTLQGTKSSGKGPGLKMDEHEIVLQLAPTS